MAVFSDNQRIDCSAKPYSESSYSYLDRSARPQFARVRNLLETWFAELPIAEREALLSRFQSGDDVEFHASFLELYLYQLLKATGHSVDFHPDLRDTSNHPDYMATDREGSRTLLECTVVSEESDDDRAAHARLDVLLDSINRFASPDVFFGIEIHGSPRTPVPGKKWRAVAEEWVRSLDYEKLIALGPDPNFSEVPTLELQHDGLVMTLRPIPKRENCRGQGHRPVGALFTGAFFVNSHESIRDKIQKKATRYGRPDLPLIIFVNCLGELADWEEVWLAIYGPHGIWGEPGRPSNKRLSAVIATLQLLPWSIGTAEVRVFRNPNATHPYSGPLNTLQNQQFDGSWVDGLHPRTYFGLDLRWPDI